jgi:hypothetical protein
VTDNRITQARKLPKRFSAFDRRPDRRRLAELDRARPARLARARVPLAKVQDLDVPWLRLSPLHAEVEGKGHVDFWDPSFVGFNTIELAAFDAAYEKKMPDQFAIVRGALGLTIEPEAAKSLVELTVFAHVDGGAKPVFEVWADNDMQTHQVEDAKPDVITVVAHSSVWMRLEVPGQTASNLVGTGGGWAFYELRVTPLD